MFLVHGVNAGHRSEKFSAYLDMTPEAVSLTSRLAVLNFRHAVDLELRSTSKDQRGVVLLLSLES